MGFYMLGQGLQGAYGLWNGRKITKVMEYRNLIQLCVYIRKHKYFTISHYQYEDINYFHLKYVNFKINT